MSEKTISHLKILKDFPFAHGGCRVVQYTKGSTIETDDPELVKVAVEEKWAKEVKASESDADAKAKADADAKAKADADAKAKADADAAGNSQS